MSLDHDRITKLPYQKGSFRIIENDQCLLRKNVQTKNIQCLLCIHSVLIPVSITSIYVATNNSTEPLGVRPEMLHPRRSGPALEAGGLRLSAQDLAFWST